MTKEKNLFKIIATIIALDMLYNNFNTTIVSILTMGNKFIDEIFIII